MNKKKVLMIIGIVLGIIIICGSFTAIVLMSLNNAKANDDSEQKEEVIVVPNVLGMKKEEAIRTLEEKGLVAKIAFVNDTYSVEGTVIKSEPRAEQRVDKNSKVTIYVSIGGEKVIIEDYKGKNYVAIKMGLEAQGIRVTVKKKEANEKYDYNQIVDQSVEAGKTLNEGDSIILYIPDSPKVYYPDFTTGEYTVKEVKDFCDRYGISLKTFYVSPEDDNLEEGKVFFQDKSTNDAIGENDELTIKVVKR